MTQRKRYYGADVPRSTGPHPDPIADLLQHLREVSSAYCPKCSEPELEFGTCKYCGFDVAHPNGEIKQP